MLEAETKLMWICGWRQMALHFSSDMEVSINGSTPSHHQFLDGIFCYKPTILGYPILRNPHIREMFMTHYQFRSQAT